MPPTQWSQRKASGALARSACRWHSRCLARGSAPAMRCHGWGHGHSLRGGQHLRTLVCNFSLSLTHIAATGWGPNSKVNMMLVCVSGLCDSTIRR